MKVKVFKLKSGEEFIAEVVDQTDTLYAIEKPVVVIPVGEAHAFSPWIATSVETSFSLPASDVRYCVDPVQDLVSAYEQQFGIGIIKPTAKQIITG